MIVDVMMRISIDEGLSIVDAGALVENRMVGIDTRLVALETKYEARLGRPADQRMRAVLWLRDRLDQGPVMARDLLQEAILEGLSKGTVHRAADEMGIVRTPAKGGATCRWRLKK